MFINVTRSRSSSVAQALVSSRLPHRQRRLLLAPVASCVAAWFFSAHSGPRRESFGRCWCYCLVARPAHPDSPHRGKVLQTNSQRCLEPLTCACAVAFSSSHLLLFPASPQLNLSSMRKCCHGYTEIEEDDGDGVRNDKIPISSYEEFTNPQFGESMIGELGFSAIIRKFSDPMRCIKLYLPPPGVEELERLALHALKVHSSASRVCSRMRARYSMRVIITSF